MRVSQPFVVQLLTFVLIISIPNSFKLLTTALPADLKPDLSGQQRQIEPKYFFEPSGSQDLAHYDIRYFSGIVTSEERLKSLKDLIRSYMKVFQAYNIETWIAHGTLLGWWWNGKILSWDWDLDTQVSESTLKWIGQHLNMTSHNVTFIENFDTFRRREYLLDVNPYFRERVRGDGNNVIDARWIDTQNGLYIDITGLSETQPGVLSCKNNHHYRIRDLYPLRDSTFEDFKVKIPYRFDAILTKEYSDQALIRTFHEGHRWVPEQRAWIKEP